MTKFTILILQTFTGRSAFTVVSDAPTSLGGRCRQWQVRVNRVKRVSNWRLPVSEVGETNLLSGWSISLLCVQYLSRHSSTCWFAVTDLLYRFLSFVVRRDHYFCCGLCLCKTCSIAVVDMQNSYLQPVMPRLGLQLQRKPSCDFHATFLRLAFDERSRAAVASQSCRSCNRCIRYVNGHCPKTKEPELVRAHTFDKGRDTDWSASDYDPDRSWSLLCPNTSEIFHRNPSTAFM